MTKIRNKLLNIEKKLNETFVEREQEIHNALLTMLSRTTTLFYGPPGTAKSIIVEAICSHIKDAVYFRKQLFSELPPEGVLGPYNVKKLTEGVFERNVDGYLPTAHLGFIDEVFRASPGVLDSLFGIMNEREFRNGKKVLRTPWLGLFFATNKIPKNVDAAFLDRFYLKSHVRRVQRTDHMAEILFTWNGSPMLKVDRSNGFTERVNPNEKDMVVLENLEEATEEIFKLKLIDKAAEAASKIYSTLNASGFDVSERKMKVSMRLAASEAWLGGSETIEPEHMAILMDIIPCDPEQVSRVADVVLIITNPSVARMFQIWNSITQDFNDIKDAADKDGKWHDDCKKHAPKFASNLKEMEELFQAIPMGSSGEKYIRRRADQILTFAKYASSHIKALANLDVNEAVKL